VSIRRPAGFTLPPDAPRDAAEGTAEDPDEVPSAAGRVASLLAANRGAGVARDPDGMGTARQWRDAIP
jgi:hypothetical protein